MPLAPAPRAPTRGPTSAFVAAPVAAIWTEVAEEEGVFALDEELPPPSLSGAPAAPHDVSAARALVQRLRARWDARAKRGVERTGPAHPSTLRPSSPLVKVVGFLAGDALARADGHAATASDIAISTRPWLHVGRR